MAKLENIIGKQYGKLFVKSRSIQKTKNTTLWNCQCECGTEIIVRKTNLTSGHTKSCGCLSKETNYNNFAKQNKYIFKEDYIIGITYNTNKNFFIDKEDFDKIKEHCWYEAKNNYIVTKIKKTNQNISIQNMILDKPKNKIVDHINRNKYDNRRSNLRIVTKQQNTINKSKQQNNKSGIVGVFFDNSRNKWVANLGFMGKKYRKRFDTKEEAHSKRKEYEKKYFKQYAPDLAVECGIDIKNYERVLK